MLRRRRSRAASVPGVTGADASFQQLGVDPAVAALRFGEDAKSPTSGVGQRLLWLADDPAFELTYWCGTCPVVFKRLAGANGTLSVPELEAKLGQGLRCIDPDVLSTFGTLLPADNYLPLLLQVTPRLVMPVDEADYFAHEQVATWGIDPFWGLPENPRTPYYRTFEAPVQPGAHLYEFVVPMVPPVWNDPTRVAAYEQALRFSALPTVVAVSTLDITQPATDSMSSDYYQHWALTHFVLDGHHKLEAAARTGRPLQLLALVAVGASLSRDTDIARLPELRRSARQDRRAE
jgi:hypothetical protein